MATPEQIIQAYYEADWAFQRKYAAALARDEFVSLPPDVRDARAGLECAGEIERRMVALVALEQLKADRQERWIAAHEDVYGVRVAARQ